MKFQECEKAKLWQVADVMNESDRNNYARGRPTEYCRFKLKLWWCNFTGRYQLSDALYKKRFPTVENRRDFLRNVARVTICSKKDESLQRMQATCLDCTWNGLLVPISKLDAMCPSCGGIHLDFK